MEVPLRNGQVALVDDEDYEKVAGLPWTVDALGYVHAWVGDQYNEAAKLHFGEFALLNEV